MPAAAPTPTATSGPPPTPFPFEILEVLGEGAFGAVCVARWLTDPLQRQLAIKILKAEYVSNPKVLNRTRDEARLMSRMHHPNIVTVEALVEVDQRPILVMELVRGLDLKSLLRRSPYGIPASVAMEVIRTTCVALQAAFEALGDDGKQMRVIHRDIKPSNMLLSVHGQLKVVDFGIATGEFSGRESKTDSLVMGSRPYMAPERLDSNHRDTPGVDIYSAGMSLYELLTGHTMPLSVIPSSHDKALTEHVAALKPVGLQPPAAAELRRLVQRMCSYDQSFRPTAREAAQELTRLIEGMDAAHRLTLEEFARDVVLPLYDERKRIPLKIAVAKLQDKELLGDVIKAPSGPRPAPPGASLRRRPAIFVGGLLGMVAALGGVAGNKLAHQRAGPDAAEAALTVSVRLWFPKDAQARVGSQGLAVPGRLQIPGGPQELDLRFDDGRTLRCLFEARQGIAVRFVTERGVGGISIDDGPMTPCREAGR